MECKLQTFGDDSFNAYHVTEELRGHGSRGQMFLPETKWHVINMR